MESIFPRASSPNPVPADVAVHKKPPDSSPPVGRHMFVKKVGRLFNCRKLSLQIPGLLTSECGDNLYSRFSPRPHSCYRVMPGRGGERARNQISSQLKVGTSDPTLLEVRRGQPCKVGTLQMIQRFDQVSLLCTLSDDHHCVCFAH